MKTKLFFIFATQLLFAQSPDLLNTNWQITQIIHNGQTYVPPPMPSLQSTQFSTTSPNLMSYYFNVASGTVIFGTSNTFETLGVACTFADYWGDNGAVNQFFDRNCSFFTTPGVFSYNITQNGQSKNMVITNAVDNQIHYTYSILATAEPVSPSFKLHPNPATDILNIDDAEGIFLAVIYDLSGKKVFEGKYGGKSRVQINVAFLESGIYLISVNGQSSYKIKKK